MSSTSAAGVSIVTLQFTLGQTLDVAEQEVQAAINAGGSLLPADLPAPPVYAKVNPADAPVLTLAITSDTMPLTEVQNIVSTRLALKISQVSGVGLVSLSGGQRPAVRIQADTRALASYGLGLDTLRTAIAAANANSAKGNFDGPTRSYTINANDQLLTAADYSNLIIAYRNGAPVRLSHIAQVVESAENVKLGAWADTKPAIILNVQRQPGANVIATVRWHQGPSAGIAGRTAERSEGRCVERPHDRHSGLGQARRNRTGAGGGAGGAGNFRVPSQSSRNRHCQPCSADIADRHLRRHVPSRLQPQ